MDNATKKRVTGALVAPVLSLTILCAGGETAFADNLTLMDKFFSTGKKKPSQSSQAAANQASSETSPRLTQLEQAVRDLTAQVESLQLTLLQMQNRLDVLEGRTPSQPQIEAARTPTPAPTTLAFPAAPQSEMTPDQASETSVPVMTTQIFGSIRFDGSGNLLENILPETHDSQEFYKIGYQHILAGDYPAAEKIFRAFRERFPDDAQIADASFWLGEALYAQGQYREAAQIYIDVQRQEQNSTHGPENLLKLGLSMAQLQEEEVACKTLNEVPKRYAQAGSAVLKRVDDEKNRLGCP